MSHEFLSVGYWRSVLPWYAGRLAKSRGYVSIDGCRFDVSSPQISRYMAGTLMLGRYEESERRLLRRFLDADLPVIELGGSTGVVACLTNKRLRYREDQIVVEANPRLLPVLKKNRLLNDCHFSVVHGAIAYGRQNVTFAVDDGLVAGRILQEPGGETVITVPTVQLRSLIRDRGWRRCSLVCDIEGAEADLVSSDLEVIADSVSWILMETHVDARGIDSFEYAWPLLRQAAFEHINSDGSVHVFRATRH